MAALHFYDLRGDGLETQNKSDKQGLGLSRCNKHRFAAQEMLILLAQLVHNLIIWTRNDLADPSPSFASMASYAPSAMSFTFRAPSS